MNKWMIVMIALVVAVSAVPASAEYVTSNGASFSVTSIAIRAGDGGSLPTSILVDETFTVLITEDGSTVGAGTSVAFMLPHDTGDPIYCSTDDNGKVTYTPLITGILGIRVRDGTVTVAEATVNVVTTIGEIPTLGSITISPDSADLLIGDIEPFTAICYDTSGNPMSPGCVVEWACDTDAVGTIDSSGLFTAGGVGTATVTVTATYEGVTTTNIAIVTVSAPTETVDLTDEGSFTEEIDAGTAADVTVDGTFDNSVTGSIVMTSVADPEETVGSYAFTGNDEALMGLTVTPDAAVIAELADGNDTIRIEMCYNATELASKGISSSTLAIHRYDVAAAAWVKMVAGTDPCVANGITGTCVWIEVNNLSTFALVGTKTAAPAPSGGGGGHGGTYPPGWECNTIEIRGAVMELSGAQAADLVWNAYNFGAFWYDLDNDLMTERLTIAATDPYGNPTLTGPSMDRTIDRNCLMYQTTPVYQEYEIYANEGLTVDGDAGYYLEGWMGDQYVAINNNADKLCELLVEFEGDDKKTLAAGEAGDIGGGFSLEPKQIDLEGNKVWFCLSKDGSELDNEVVSGGDVYTYTADIGGENDVPVFSCYVYATFRGTDSNLVQIKYVFLIDNEVLEIECGDEFGIMEVTTACTSYIALENDENTINLDTDTVEHIMGDMYFKIADDDTAIRFYPFVEYTDPGMCEIRGAVQNFVDMQSTDITWNAYNFGAFWYDLDDDLVTETLTIAADTLSAPWDRTIDANNLVYNTTATDVDFDYSGWGEYNVIGFMAEKYFAGYDGTETDDEITNDDISLVSNNMLSKVLIDEDDKYTISTGASLELAEGYELKIIQLDISGDNAQIELLRNGKTVDVDIINAPDTYVYPKDIGMLDDVPIIAIHVSSVYAGTETDTVTMDGIFQISEDYISVEHGDEFGAMEVATVCSGAVTLENKYPIDLDEGTQEHIMGNMYFKTADDASTVRFYPFIERTIGGGVAPAEPTPTPADTISSADTDGDGVPDVWDVDNSTSSGYWVNSDGIGRRWGDMNGDGELTSVDALMILQAAAGKIGL